jgi:hypothetical protein
MAQLDWFIQPPPGAAFHVAIDGTLRLRFDSSQADSMAQWARDWVRTFEQYTRMRSPQYMHNVGPMPKTLEEIHAFVAKLNAANKATQEPVPDPSDSIIMTTPSPAPPASAPPAPPIEPQGSPFQAGATKEPSLAQCSKCLGILNEPDEPTCEVCKGVGYVNAR